MVFDAISQLLSNTQSGQQAYFSTTDHIYSCRHLQLHEDIAKHCNFNIICHETTGTYRFRTGFYGLTDMLVEIQKAMDYTLTCLQNAYCFRDDIIIVTTGSESDHINYVNKCLEKQNEDNLRISKNVILQSKKKNGLIIILLKHVFRDSKAKQPLY